MIEKRAGHTRLTGQKSNVREAQAVENEPRAPARGRAANTRPTAARAARGGRRAAAGARAARTRARAGARAAREPNIGLLEKISPRGAAGPLVS